MIFWGEDELEKANSLPYEMSWENANCDTEPSERSNDLNEWASSSLDGSAKGNDSIQIVLVEMEAGVTS